jgi:Flp pilus assembly pilin Flp
VGDMDADAFFGVACGESGQTMPEYALVLGVLSIAAVITLGLLSDAILTTLRATIALI